MDIGLIELVDSGVRCFDLRNRDRNKVCPGYAMIDEKEIVVGDVARRHAFLKPQVVFNQYWQLLNLSPLAYKSSLARHNADLAFTHLNSLFEVGEIPEEIVLAIPGSFDREQLGLILGLTKAAKFNVVGVVDAALLDVAGADSLPLSTTDAFLYVDIHLQQLVVTEINVADSLSKGDVKTFSELGLRSLLDTWAHTIAEKFIQQYRFDPMHNAKGEQQIHDLLPGWLNELNRLPEVPIELSSSQGNFRLNIGVADLSATLAEKLSKLHDYLDKSGNNQVVLSHRLSLLPGIANSLPNKCEIGEASLVNGLKKNLSSIVSSSDRLVLVDRLDKQNDPVRTESIGGSENNIDDLISVDNQVTHILYRGQAKPISEKMHFEHQPDSCFSVFRKNESGWQLLDVERVRHSAKESIKPGDCIYIDEDTLQLISLVE